ncbi:hypothetical protein A0H81_05034 [Grifola frondosa]|uniref:Uncharacterized protein n=1 Tax=Grifola frondosa TaxID=5627 RepID=A0A1C7MG71_GRIFR|nr:hypothetical protein A0H81_05034 [Grifola frondosa]
MLQCAPASANLRAPRGSPCYPHVRDAAILALDKSQQIASNLSKSWQVLPLDFLCLLRYVISLCLCRVFVASLRNDTHFVLLFSARRLNVSPPFSFLVPETVTSVQSSCLFLGLPVGHGPGVSIGARNRLRSRLVQSPPSSPQPSLRKHPDSSHSSLPN